MCLERRQTMSTFIKDELDFTIKQSLEQIVDHFHLEEVGSPYMELHAFAAGRPTSKLGDVRVWHPRAGIKESPVEKLVHLKFSVKKLTSQWLFAFSSGNSLVPHFSLGLSTSGSSEGTCGAHVDLISKVRVFLFVCVAVGTTSDPPANPGAAPPDSTHLHTFLLCRRLPSPRRKSTRGVATTHSRSHETTCAHTQAQQVPIQARTRSQAHLYPASGPLDTARAAKARGAGTLAP